MRFIVMHKNDAGMEAGVRPSQDIISGMSRFIGEELKKGVFKDGAGLRPSNKRVRVRKRGGKIDITPGPFAGDNELVGSMAMLKTRSVDEAVEHVKRLASSVNGDCEIEVGLVVEGWDLTGSPKPPHVEHDRFLLLMKGEGVSLPSDAALTNPASLQPSKSGARLPSGPKGKRTWTDGPFAESKELIAGFSIIDVPTMRDALAWADHYASILDGNEVDVRVIA
jgi:hypothetical protein